MTHLLLAAFAEGDFGFLSNPMVPLILMGVIFWFLVISPMLKRQKAMQRMLESLKKGDRVITTGGLHGEVVSVKDDVLLIKLAENLKVKVSKSAISGLQGSEES